MKRNFKHLVLLLALLPMSKVQGQISFDYLRHTEYGLVQDGADCQIFALARLSEVLIRRS